MQAKLFLLKLMLNKLFNILSQGGNTITLLLRNKIKLLQSNNQHKLLRNLKTKCRHYVVALNIICCTATITNAQNIITATATQPNVYGGCIDSIFTLQYYSPSAHTLTINASLATPPNQCDGQQGTHTQVVIIFDTIIRLQHQCNC